MSLAVETAAVPTATTSTQATDDSTRELTVADLHAALSDLGHNSNGELVYTKCQLSSRHHSRLPGLERYTNLQQLSLDHNRLTELTAVRNMPQLVYLSARHNQLTSAVFDSLAGAAACLERLHLDGNCLTTLNGLETLPFITDFSCSNNQIESVPARCLSAARRLMRLRLAHNSIFTIDANAFEAATRLRLVELQHNKLTDVKFLHSVAPQVEQLALADNQIVHLSRAVQHLTGLVSLDLSRNALASLPELLVLKSLVMLRELAFDGNPELSQLSPQQQPRSPRGDEADLPVRAGDRTEYHAEVVMSDEEEGHDTTDLRGSGLGASGYADERSCTANPASTAADGGESSGTSYNSDGATPTTKPGKVMSEADRVLAGVAAPTTASYVALAAPETHGFIHTVGCAARDAELSVRVDYAKEIVALPAEEQVYLWTLAALPHLSALNGRAVTSEDVARAHFLFHSTAS